jgi:phenylpropionate dioxygenase-like ring-hydroxylating dioxygenase large terminal subunit
MSISEPSVRPENEPERQAPSFGDIGRRFAGLPMPRNPQLLQDAQGRPRVLDPQHKRFPFPVPNGWFIVARADELAPGEVMPLYCFGRNLVLFRTESGAPRVMDAHCPHLGAHLGVGGRVAGETIQCPFHGWRFEGSSGACVEVPYDDVDYIPKRANTRAYPTLERNQMIWAWHHLEGGDPFYDVPVVPEFDDPDWLAMDVREFAVASCCQEMAENNYDTVHFKYVHGSDSIPTQKDLIDGFYKRSETLDGSFVREGFGLGLGVLRMKRPEITFTFLSNTTPIDEENLLVRWLFTSPKSVGEELARLGADSFCAGVSQDIPIWENKIYKDPPVLRPMEKAVTEHRRWSRQFYSYIDETHPGLAR